MIADIWLWLTPLFILGALLLIVGAVALLARVQGGKYLRPVMQWLAKLPIIGRGINGKPLRSITSKTSWVQAPH